MVDEKQDMCTHSNLINYTHVVLCKHAVIVHDSGFVLRPTTPGFTTLILVKGYALLKVRF